jgi:hypothetical protein
MNWQQALLGLCLAFFVLCVLSAAFSRSKRNRRVGLPPPSDACKRRGPEAVP